MEDAWSLGVKCRREQNLSFVIGCTLRGLHMMQLMYLVMNDSDAVVAT